MSEYKGAGVDIDAGNEAVNRIKERVRLTFRPEVRTDLGTFGALFAFDKDKYKKPLLVSGTDGVGTKLKIAFAMSKNNTVGIDLVAMSVNDVMAMGAEPLFFLDYIACSKVVPETISEIVEGIVIGCQESDCALIGGETAEMPGMYAPGEYDLAGFCLGVVDEEKVIDGRHIKEGDAVVALPSSGLHSNGFSLARKVLLEDAGLKLSETVAPLARPLGEELLTPTRIYAPLLKRLWSLHGLEIRGIAHITGGGLVENVSRIVPPGLQVRINRGAWPVPPIFQLIRNLGKLPEEEMYRVFNMGVGMVLIVPQAQLAHLLKTLKEWHEHAYQIGKIEQGPGGVVFSAEGR